MLGALGVFTNVSVTISSYQSFLTKVKLLCVSM